MDLEKRGLLDIKSDCYEETHDNFFGHPTTHGYQLEEFMDVHCDASSRGVHSFMRDGVPGHHMRCGFQRVRSLGPFDNAKPLARLDHGCAHGAEQRQAGQLTVRM